MQVPVRYPEAELRYQVVMVVKVIPQMKVQVQTDAVACSR